VAFNSARLNVLTEKKNAQVDKLAAIVERVQARPDQRMLASEVRATEVLEDKIRKLDGKIAEQKLEWAREDRAAAAVASLIGGKETARVSVGNEARIYRPDATDAAGRPFGYFHDLFKSQNGNMDARARLQRHAQEVWAEEKRTNPNTTAGTGGEFVPPAWLVAQYIPVLRAGRVTADRCMKFPMIPGVDVINIPKITTGGLTAIQTANAAPVASRDPQTTSVAANVNTIAGQVDISLQLLEQSPIAMDGVIFQDLQADLNKQLDLQVLTGTGSNGQLTGILNVASIGSVTYTDASPTATAMFPKLANAVSIVASNRFAPPEAWIMHPRRWLWLSSQLDGQNRPVVVPAVGAFNEMAVAGDLSLDGSVGTLLNLPVYLDANISITSGGGTQDTIICGRFTDTWLYESVVRLRSLIEVLSGTMQLRLQTYQYVALATRLAQSLCTVTGTGLALTGWT
jgi:HK97 family phage major capsid protein